MNKLTDIDYWENIQGNPCVDLDKNNIIKEWIESHIDLKKIKRCVEIGCYPGRYLSIFGDHGVEVNGVDYLPNVSRIEELCISKGYKTGKFYCLDFHAQKLNEKFDCVYSLGFIEHFDDWENVFKKHLDLVTEEGLIIVEAPNFKGWMQRIPRLLFDCKTLKKHNLSSMDLTKWEKIIKENGFETITADYFGGYNLWYDKKSSKAESYLRKLSHKIFRLLKIIIYRKTKNDPSFSSYVGIIAKKRCRSELQNK